MKRIICDRCGAGADKPIEATQATVFITITGTKHFDLCQDCNAQLVKWFSVKPTQNRLGTISNEILQVLK